MPFQKFTKKVKGKTKYWIKNIQTGKVTCYKSDSKRSTGIAMKYKYAGGR